MATDQPIGAFQAQLDDTLRQIFMRMIERGMDHAVMKMGAVDVQITMVSSGHSQGLTEIVGKYLEGILK